MNLPHAVTASGPIRCHSLRLRRGMDLMQSVKSLCAEKNIAAGVVLSAVGCISQEELVGQLVLRIWPLENFGPIS